MLIVAASMLIVAATFARTLLGTYAYDDLELIAANPLFEAETDWWAVVAQPLWGEEFPHWRPLTQVLLAAGARVGPAGIHALALASHLAAVGLAYLLALGATRQRLAAFFVALWFGLHPAQVESVAWCSALNDVLWGTLALSALMAHARDRARGVPAPSWRVVVCFALALLAKETALVVPLLLAWFDVTHRRAAGARTAWYGYLRFLLVLGPWLVVRALVFGDWRAGFDRGPALAVEPGGPLWLGAKVFGALAGVLAWPFHPDALRPVPSGAEGVGFVLLAAGVGVALGWTAWRGARVPLFGLGVVAIVLGVHAARPRALSEYPIADRYVYVAVFGGALAIVPTLLRWRFGTWIAAGLALVFAGVSFVASGAWASQAAFVAAELARGDDARVHYMAGQLALEKPRDLDVAEREFARAARLAAAPRHGGEAGRARLVADVETGQAWCAFFRAASAPVPDFRRPAAMFAAILQAHEEHAPSHVGLAVCLAELGDRTGAERHLLRALELDPADRAASTNLARLRSRR